MEKRLVRAAYQPEDGAVDCYDARATPPLLQNWRFWSDVSSIHCSGTIYVLLNINKIAVILMGFVTDPESHLHLFDCGSTKQLKKALH